MNKHTFAIYKDDIIELVSGLRVNATISFKHAATWTRLTKVIRVKPGDLFVLFDKNINVTIEVPEQGLQKKRTIEGTIRELKENVAISPRITYYLPILKKEAFEYAAYVCAQMGVSEIVPIITEKAQTSWYKEKEKERLRLIMAGACEQSKNFVLPKLRDMLSFADSIARIREAAASQKICFYEDGDPAKTIATKLTQDDIIITLGPEGGLTQSEVNALRATGFMLCKLTPTILRSQEAVCVGVGLIRSFAAPIHAPTITCQ